MALHKAHNFMDADLEADIDAYLDWEEEDPEEEQARYEAWCDMQFEIARERRIFGDDF